MHVSGARYKQMVLDEAYRVHMKLTIRAVTNSEYGTYKCVSKNSLGDTDGTIKVYRKLWQNADQLKCTRDCFITIIKININTDVDKKQQFTVYMLSKLFHFDL